MSDNEKPRVNSQGSDAAAAQQPAGLQEAGTASALMPGDEHVEEGSGAYKPGHFHPVYIGDIYNGGTWS